MLQIGDSWSADSKMLFLLKPNLSNAFLRACLRVIANKRQKYVRKRLISASMIRIGSNDDFIERGREVRTDVGGGANIGWRGMGPCCLVVCL